MVKRGDTMNKKVFIQIIILSLITFISVVALWHLELANNMISWGITKTDGLFNMSSKYASLISPYVLVGTLIAYNIFILYLIFNQKNLGKGI